MLKRASYGLVRRDFRPQSIVGLVLTVVAFTASFLFVRDLDLGMMSFHFALFVLCASPYFLLAHEPRFRLLVFFMLVYYAMFGMMDYILLFTDQSYRIFTSSDLIRRTSFTDVVIFTGGVSLMVSYLVTSIVWHRRRLRQEPPAWKYKASVWFGFMCWLIGIVAQFIVQFVYWTSGPAKFGLISHLISNLFYLALLGGIIMITAALNNRHARLAWILLAIMVGVEFVFGFLGNTKEVSFRLGVLVLITLFFFRGRISFPLIALLFLLFIPYQAVFKIYREKVIQIHEQSALDAIMSMDQSLEKVAKGALREKNAALKSLFFFLDRVDGRKYVEIITQRTGSQVPYLHGETLMLYFYSFIPRMIWPDKPQISTGQLMNRTFNLSASPLTFVPSTQLGEFYWNFGMPGVIFGMAFVGMLLALINGAFLSGSCASTVGMLVILVAFYFLVMRFESGFASQYNQFTRVVALIGLMAFIFSHLGWTERRQTVDEMKPRDTGKEERQTKLLPTPTSLVVASSGDK